MSRVSWLSTLERYALTRFWTETGVVVVRTVRHGVEEVRLAALRLVVGRGKVGRRGRRWDLIWHGYQGLARGARLEGERNWLSSKGASLCLEERGKLTSGDGKGEPSSGSRGVGTASFIEAFDGGCPRRTIMATEGTLELRCRYWNRIEAVWGFRLVVAAEYWSLLSLRVCVHRR